MNGFLYYQGLLYIPNGPCRLQVLQSYHDFSTTGHFGFNKTMELISHDFWWKHMWPHMFPFQGSLSSSVWVITPTANFKETLVSISMDFITNLPSSKAFDSFFVMVDQLTKMAHFMPYNKTVISEETTRLFMDNITSTMAFLRTLS
jgi:hypothetical protein